MRVLLLAFLGFAACSGGGGDPTPEPTDVEAGFEGDQPDIVLLTVSGRNLNFSDLLCPPACNLDYLRDPGRAGPVIQAALMDVGYTVESRHFIAAIDSYDDTGDQVADRLGCAKLIQDLRWIHEHWVEGQASPTRIVLVGHSHGCVWAHNVVSALPEIAIDFLVSLDGVSTQWEADHVPSIEQYYAAKGGNPFAVDLRDVTEVWNGQDTKDIAFDHVAMNIEVRSDNDCGLCIFDAVDNMRIDGSFGGIVSFESSGEDHSEITISGSASMLFVVDQLLTALVAP